MNRIETYCDGRLVKSIARINMGPTIAAPYDTWVDGRHVWLLDGQEITEEEAQRLISEWPR